MCIRDRYVPLLVAEVLGQNLILGADLIRKTGLILDIYAKQYFFRFDRTRKYQFDSKLSNCLLYTSIIIIIIITKIIII